MILPLRCRRFASASHSCVVSLQQSRVGILLIPSKIILLQIRVHLKGHVELQGGHDSMGGFPLNRRSVDRWVIRIHSSAIYSFEKKSVS
jgi:hypothetical protein